MTPPETSGVSTAERNGNGDPRGITAEPFVPAASEDAIGGLIDWMTFWNVDRDEAEWIYDDVLARARGHSIYASHKDGKSLFMLWIAGHLATGPEPVVVIYLDYEMTEADVRERLEAMGYGPGSDLSRFNYHLLPTLPSLDSPDGGQALIASLDRVQAAWPGHHLVVILDTFSRAVYGPESEADTVRDFYNRTGIELKRRGVTWVRLDHAGYDQSHQRGSTAKGDDVDVVWRLVKTQNGVCLKRDAARMNWVPEKVSFGMLDDPLRYQRLTDDYPEGTGETANLLSRLEVPLDASGRTAMKALKDFGEGRRWAVVAAALRFRRDRLNERSAPAAETPEVLSEQAEFDGDF